MEPPFALPDHPGPPRERPRSLPERSRSIPERPRSLLERSRSIPERSGSALGACICTPGPSRSAPGAPPEPPRALPEHPGATPESSVSTVFEGWHARALRALDICDPKPRPGLRPGPGSAPDRAPPRTGLRTGPGSAPDRAPPRTVLRPGLGSTPGRAPPRTGLCPGPGSAPDRALASFPRNRTLQLTCSVQLLDFSKDLNAAIDLHRSISMRLRGRSRGAPGRAMCGGAVNRQPGDRARNHEPVTLFG